MDELIWGIEPAHVLVTALGVGGAIIGFQFKINRCIGRLEANVNDLSLRLNTIANSYLSHLDKPK